MTMDNCVCHVNKFSTLCPYILGSVDSKSLICKKVDADKMEVAHLFQVAMQACKHILTSNHKNKLLSYAIFINGNQKDTLWLKIEWIHFILKILFSYENLLFGKFYHINYPSLCIESDPVLLVIRKFDKVRDKGFIEGRLRAQQKLAKSNLNFHKTKLIIDFTVDDISADLDASRKVFNALKYEFGLTTSSTGQNTRYTHISQ